MGVFLIGAKDKIDRALVKNYANVKTTNFDSPKLNPDDILKIITQLSMIQRNFYIKASLT